MSKRKNITVVLMAMFLPAIFAYFYFVVLRESSYANPVYLLSRFFLIMLPWIWVIAADKEKFPIVRFKKEGLFAGFESGLFIGAVIVATYFLILKGVLNLGEIRVKAEVFNISDRNFLFVALFFIFINSALEEYYWRWFTYSKLRTLFKGRKAILLSAFGFTLHHIIILVLYFGVLFGLLFSFGVFIGGAIWSYFYQKFDSIIPCFVSHSIVDASLIVIGYDILFV